MYPLLKDHLQTRKAEHFISLSPISHHVLLASVIATTQVKKDLKGIKQASITFLWFPIFLLAGQSDPVALLLIGTDAFLSCDGVPVPVLTNGSRGAARGAPATSDPSVADSQPTARAAITAGAGPLNPSGPRRTNTLSSARRPRH